MTNQIGFKKQETPITEIKPAKIVGQDTLVNEVSRIFKIFKASNAAIRPHFVLAGESGSGKTFTINNLCLRHKLGFFEINAAQLTKEGTSGNSLSKALTPLLQLAGKPAVVFVDEFDKLFISGNTNTQLAHESTNGVQNEFLKVLESDYASVFGDYGKYVNASVKNVLFVFAGAFNGEPNITVDKLRSYGVKTEFLGRVGLVYNAKRLSISNLFEILENSEILNNYLELFKGTIERETVINDIKDHLERTYNTNTLGARAVNTLINRYFIKGGDLTEEEANENIFQETLNFDTL